MYDVIIIGGGPAGITAAIYCARYRLKTMMIAKEIGGTANKAPQVDNFPSYPGVSGFELMMKFKKHLDIYKEVENIYDEAIAIAKNLEITTKTNKKYKARVIIFTTGMQKRKLNIPGEDEFLGKGVSYCASCDAALYRGKEVAIAGSGDSAVKAAILIAEYAKNVYLISRGDKLKAEPLNIITMNKAKNIHIIYNANIIKIMGKKFVEAIELDNGKNVKMEGVFIEIGSIPSTDLLKQVDVKLDENNYVKVNKKMETNINGIYAAGDITDNPFKQIITACGEGAVAAWSAYYYLKKEE